MGQQLPYLPGGQNPYGQQFPAAPALPIPGQPNPAAMAAPTQNPAIPGVDPHMMQAAQQSLANPNGGDVMSSILPGPKELGLGAAAGIATAGVFAGLDHIKAFETGSEWLDKIPGAKALGRKLEQHQTNPNNKFFNHPKVKEFFLTDAIVPKGSPQTKIDSAVQSAVDKMEKRHLQPVVEQFRQSFTHKKSEADAKEMKAAYEKLLKDLGHTEPYHNLLVEGEPWKHTVIGRLTENEGNRPVATYQQLKDQFGHLDAIKNKTKPQEALAKLLRQTKESAGSISELYTPLYESQARLTAELSAKGVGPVGRVARSFTNYLQRIFRGDTMKMGSGGGGFLKNAGSLFGPVVMGAFIFGFSFQSAKNAKDGEKKQAFFHNLLGAQIFNFIGWEFGRKALNAIGFRNILGRFAKKTPLALLRKIPLLGGLLGGITLGGLATELVAMLVIGGAFQKVGEKLSHAIFGKPSQASIDGKGNSPGLPNAAGQQAQQNQNQGQNPNPMLSGVTNPVLMNQGLQAAGRTPYASNPALPTPSQAYPIGAQARPMPYAAKSAAAVTPPQPKFSLSPAQISQSRVANDYNTYYSKLKADKTLDKRPGELLDKM